MPSFAPKRQKDLSHLVKMFGGKESSTLEEYKHLWHDSTEQVWSGKFRYTYVNFILFVLEPKSTCLRELPYVPVSPTLMDLIAIIGLKPLGKTYSLGLFEDQIERSEVKIDGSAKSYGGFI